MHLPIGPGSSALAGHSVCLDGFPYTLGLFLWDQGFWHVSVLLEGLVPLCEIGKRLQLLLPFTDWVIWPRGVWVSREEVFF